MISSVEVPCPKKLFLLEGEKLLWCSLAYSMSRSALQNLAERKKKSLSERAQAEEEMEEIRRSYQEELDKLRQLLKKARTSTDQAAAEQVRGQGSCCSRAAGFVGAYRWEIK